MTTTTACPNCGGSVDLIVSAELVLGMAVEVEAVGAEGQG